MALILLLLRIYTLAGFAIILSVCDNHFGKTKVLPIPPTLFSLLFVLSVVASAIVKDLYSKPKFQLLTSIVKNNKIVLGPFFLIVFFSLLGAIHDTAYWGSGGTWIFLNSYNFVILFLAMLTPAVTFVRNNYRLIMLVSLLLAIWAVAADVNTPGTFSVEINRPSGFSGNSNWGALSIVLLTTGALGYSAGKGMWLDLLILAVSGWGVFSTLSRSGSMNFIVVVGLFLYFTFFTKNGNSTRGVIILSILMSAVLFLGAIFVFNDSSDQVEVGSKSTGRLKGFLQGEIVDDGSAQARKGAALHALDLMEESPIFGHGTGYSRNMPEKPHNLFLNQGVNNGIFGLVSYILLLFGSIYHFWKYSYYPGIVFMVVIVLGSFFSHNILEQRTFLLTLGFMSTAAWLKPVSKKYVN